MTLLYMPIGRDDMFHVEQFALYAHFPQKIEVKRRLFICGMTQL
jgi:hypothetical protein